MTTGLAAALAIAAPALLAGVAPTAAATECDATLYADADFAGASERLTQDQPSLPPDLSEQASSLRIAAGRWTFFSEPSYGGATLLYSPGAYPRVPAEWNDRIASARCVDTDDARTTAGPAGPASSVTNPGAASDGAIAPAAASAAGSPPLPGGTPYFSGGQPYGWYDGGWNGAGFYVVGTQFFRGHGFGGRDGWHGWHRSFWYRYHYRFGGHGRAVQPIHFPGGQGGRRLEGGRGHGFTVAGSGTHGGGRFRFGQRMHPGGQAPAGGGVGRPVGGGGRRGGNGPHPHGGAGHGGGGHGGGHGVGHRGGGRHR